MNLDWMDFLAFCCCLISSLSLILVLVLAVHLINFFAGWVEGKKNTCPGSLLYSHSLAPEGANDLIDNCKLLIMDVGTFENSIWA